ncbi:MAG: NUDIX hydrolase [Oscillospiraceae bacterium]|nr:NUDIX hydrolase [Oscillospiraceae bacterium]
MDKWIVDDSKYIFKSPYGNLRADRCILPNGKIIHDYHVSEFVDWVNIVALTNNNEILLVKQYRQGISDFCLEIIAGGVKNEETPDEAIIRELREETGYICNKPPILLGKFYCNPAIQSNMIYMYFCDDICKCFDQKLDDTEDIEILTIPLDKINHCISNGTLSHLFSIAAINLAKPYIL